MRHSRISRRFWSSRPSVDACSGRALWPLASVLCHYRSPFRASRMTSTWRRRPSTRQRARLILNCSATTPCSPRRQLKSRTRRPSACSRGTNSNSARAPGATCRGQANGVIATHSPIGRTHNAAPPRQPRRLGDLFLPPNCLSLGLHRGVLTPLLPPRAGRRSASCHTGASTPLASAAVRLPQWMCVRRDMPMPAIPSATTRPHSGGLARDLGPRT
jgi:hypothetical protein